MKKKKKKRKNCKKELKTILNYFKIKFKKK